MKLKLFSLFPICCLLSILIIGCSRQPLYKDSRIMMGTYVSVISPDQRAAKIVFDEIKRIESLLSKYIPASEISILNNTGKVKASAETIFVVKKAQGFSRSSEGAFDITVGPLVDLWGFTNRDYRIPQAQEIQDRLKVIGSNKIIVNEEENMIQLPFQGMKVDVGGIAKGFAVDRAVKKLKEQGITSCLIALAGDIYCLGKKFGSPWRVAIRNPRAQGTIGSVALEDKAISTSGDYEQYFIRDKRRYSHIIDPRTGYPAQSSIVSVTVLAQDCLTADALATTIFVLGKEKGTEFAKKFSGVKVIIKNSPR